MSAPVDLLVRPLKSVPTLYRVAKSGTVPAEKPEADA